LTRLPAPRLTRRVLLGGLAAAASLGAAPRPARAQPVRTQTGRVLTVAGFAGPFQRAFRAAVIVPFEAAHPDLRVVYRPILNSAQLLAMLRLERAAPEIDVAIADISISILATAEGLLDTLSDRDVPHRAVLPDWARPESMNGLAFSRDNLALLYDRRVFPTPPDSWLDLARPDLADEVCMPVEDTRGVVLLPLLTRMQGGDYRRSIDPGLAMMRRFAPNVASWNAQPDLYTLILAQSAALGVGWNGRGQMIGRQNPGTIGAAIPREGSVAQINTLNLTAGSAAAGPARAFIDHALSVPVQTAFATLAYYGPTNRDVVLPDALAASIFGGPGVAARELQLDWPFVSARYSNWVRRIQREVISD